jgi:hypothetical protein
MPRLSQLETVVEHIRRPGSGTPRPAAVVSLLLHAVLSVATVQLVLSEGTSTLLRVIGSIAAVLFAAQAIAAVPALAGRS